MMGLPSKHQPNQPDFLIVGAARSGTTTMYQWLLEHPQIYVPPSKQPEPHFFLKSEHYQQGFDYYLERWFADAGHAQSRGECSTSYLYHPVVPQRIAEYLPDVKLIACLRHPVDRAYSSYLFTWRNGLEDRSFEEAIDLEAERLANPATRFDEEVRPHAYLDRSRYMQQIDRYLLHFDRGQMLVLLFDDLVEAPDAVSQRLFTFLGVDADFVPDQLHATLNSAQDASTPAMRPETRRKLVAMFADENRRLEQWLGQDLSHWNQ